MRIERYRLSRKFHWQGEFRLCAIHFDHQALLQPVAAFGLDFECGAEVWRRLRNLAADGLSFLSPVQLPFRDARSLEPLVIKPFQIAARAALDGLQKLVPRDALKGMSLGEVAQDATEVVPTNRARKHVPYLKAFAIGQRSTGVIGDVRQRKVSPGGQHLQIPQPALGVDIAWIARAAITLGGVGAFERFDHTQRTVLRHRFIQHHSAARSGMANQITPPLMRDLVAVVSEVEAFIEKPARNHNEARHACAGEAGGHGLSSGRLNNSKFARRVWPEFIAQNLNALPAAFDIFVHLSSRLQQIDRNWNRAIAPRDRILARDEREE